MMSVQRPFFSSSLAIAMAVLTALTGDLTMAAAAKPTRTATFDVADADVATLQAAMQSGHMSSQSLVRAYLARIQALDKKGPRINAVIEVNPDALTIARALDAERKAGKVRGPMHGIPVLIKDNIATLDAMQTTAGSLALVGSQPNRDAFVVTRLREAGAVILGKTNLSEWANFRSTRSTSGWSSRGGLTKNPHALDRNTSGSSSGSGAAAAAGFAAVTVGTETDGSIISPSSANGIVGFKPTLGLVSRSGIIPIAASQDTAGPMTRTVADAAVLMTAMAGTDPGDGATAGANTRAQDYTRFLDKNGLKGKRIGVVRSQFGGRNDLASAVVERALDVLRAQGAVLVDVAQLPGAGRYGTTEREVLQFEFKAGIAAYLAEYAPHSPMKSLADILAFNEKNSAQVMPFFQQELIVASVAMGGLDSQAYLDALANNHKFSREEGIDKALKDHTLDALVAPSGSPAWLTDFIRGDFSGGGFSQAAAVAGYPHVTVPAGCVAGLPVGISFVGGAWTEPALFAMAYAYEQASKARCMPKFAKTVNAR